MNESMQTLNTATAISNSFPVRKLAEVSKIELEAGQYLCRIIRKNGKDEAGNEIVNESMGVIVPAVTEEEAIKALDNQGILEGYFAWYQEQRDTVIKARVIEDGYKSIVAEDYSDAAIVEMLEKQAASEGRISKEKIGVWFENALAEKLCSALKAKYGESLSNEKVLEMKALYKAGFMMLAKREVDIAEEKKTNLLKVLELAPEGGLKKYCEGKLKEAKQVTTEMLGL